MTIPGDSKDEIRSNAIKHIEQAGKTGKIPEFSRFFRQQGSGDLGALRSAAYGWLQANDLLPTGQEPETAPAQAPAQAPSSMEQPAPALSWAEQNALRRQQAGRAMQGESSSSASSSVSLCDALNHRYTIRFTCSGGHSDHFGANAQPNQQITTEAEAKYQIETYPGKFQPSGDSYERVIQRRQAGTESIKLRVNSRTQEIQVFHCGFSQSLH